MSALPSARRSAVSRVLNDAACDGSLLLQRCAECGSVQYPPRERCGSCLGDELAWQSTDGMATVLACTALWHSLEEWFRARAPWHVASLRLDAGPVVFAHVESRNAVPGRRLRVATARDAADAWCLVAFDDAADDTASALAHTLHALEIGT